MDSVLVLMSPRFNRQYPFKSERRNISFRSFLEAGAEQGFNVYLSRYNRLDKSNKRLEKAWIYDKRWKKASDKKIDLILYHGKNALAFKICENAGKYDIPVINYLDIEKLCDDKYLTYALFQDMMPKTFLINNHFELHKALKYTETDKVVLKPRLGSYGRGVIVIDKSKLRNGIAKDTILQEFIDSSKGAKNFGISSYHDLRIIMINGKIDHAYFRIANNNFISNAHQGAAKKFIDNEDIPNSVMKELRKIDSMIADYSPRIYSADFLFDADKKPWLIEMNTKPGTLYYDGHEKIRARFHRNIFKALGNSF